MTPRDGGGRGRTAGGHSDGADGGRRARPEGASRYLPARRDDLDALAEASRGCRGCDLYAAATQTVFGEGSDRPRVVLVGEAPGDHEDLEGQPFVGPAGRVLRGALEEAGIELGQTYLTNAVKHFKFERRGTGKVRLHKRPSTAEVVACRPWLLAELEATAPPVVVALGATAGQSLLGSSFRLTETRGQILEVEGLPPLVATYHPSAVLRGADAVDRDRLRSVLVEDLRLAASLV